jgi:phosphoserine phosphatase RsbU/P
VSPSASGSANPAAGRGRIRVLLVEDDPAAARLVREQLRDAENVELAAVASTLAETLEALGRGDLDIVLLDLALPDSDGVETVAAVRAAAPLLPVVVLSGLDDTHRALEAMRHGAQEYLVKGQGAADLLARTLSYAIERKRLQDVEQLLVGVVSHDLRDPLQTIAMSFETLARSAAGDAERRTIERGRRAAARATALVHDLLDAARARLAGILPIQTSVVDLGRIALQVVDEHRERHPDRTIHVEASGDAETRADGRRIAQIVGNLLGNALQHSPPASPIGVTLQNAEHAFEIAVHSEGVIPSEMRPRIFEPLERAALPQPGARRGVGLGLFIVGEIVRAHGGQVSVDSDEGRGTTFRVRIPGGLAERPGARPAGDEVS